MKTYFPVKTDLNFYFINDETEDTAIATYVFPVGTIPTEYEVEEALTNTFNEMKIEEKGFKICSYEEFMNCIIEERTGTSGFAFTKIRDGIWWTEAKN